MLKRMRLRAPGKIGRQRILLLVFIFLIIIVAILFYKINKKLAPVLIGFAEMEANKVSSLVINLAVIKQFKDNEEIDQMFVIQKNVDDEIQMIDFKTSLVNQALTNLTKYVQSYFKDIEQGNLDNLDASILSSYDKDNLKKGIIYQMPLGLALNNSFFANLGPKVPVRLSLIGDINSNISTKITGYGINNALLEIIVHIEVTNQVMLPLLSKKLVTKIDIPLAIKLIQGKIPSSYLNTMERNSNSVVVPIE